MDGKKYIVYNLVVSISICSILVQGNTTVTGKIYYFVSFSTITGLSIFLCFVISLFIKQSFKYFNQNHIDTFWTI